MQRRRAEMAVRRLLKELGQNTKREGLLETPRRLVAALEEMLTPRPFKFTTFDAEGMSEMVHVKDIMFQSLCEHHMLPFFGSACVAYIPDGRIVGLSKIPRTVKYCSAGLQNQERITKAIADHLIYHLKPKGVGVVLRARHMCMEVRGVSMPGVVTTTSDLRGVFLDEPEARAEFLSLSRG